MMKNIGDHSEKKQSDNTTPKAKVYSRFGSFRFGVLAPLANYAPEANEDKEKASAAPKTIKLANALSIINRSAPDHKPKIADD